MVQIKESVNSDLKCEGKFCDCKTNKLYLCGNFYLCEDCACSYGEARYFEEQAKQEQEAIRNLDDCNPLGVAIL